MIGNVHELPLFSNKGTEMTLTTIAQSLWSLLWPTVFERIVYDQLYPYLEQHDIICKYQSGFRAIHSTVTTLLEATDTWAFNIDLGKINAVVFLFLKKPFDMVDHEILPWIKEWVLVTCRVLWLDLVFSSIFLYFNLRPLCLRPEPLWNFNTPFF